MSIDTGAGEGIEAAARRARYSVLREAATERDAWIVLGHHRDDQAETVLLNLLRGSGEQGLAAMRTLTRDARGTLWRPLLAMPRARLVAHAQAHGLCWLDDPANTDPRLTRNHLRHAVLPMLRGHWPGSDAALARSAQLLAEADELMQADSRRLLAECLRPDPRVLDLRRLTSALPSRGRRALRCWLADHGAAPVGVEALDELLEIWPRLRADANAERWLGGLRVRLWHGDAWLGDDNPPRVPDMPWDGRGGMPLPGGGSLVLEGAPGFDRSLQVRSRRPGDAIRLARRPSQSLKALLPTLGLPPWQRDGVPLLCDGETVLAVADLAYAEVFDHWLRQHGARLRWHAPTMG